jgi:hypothetical protein
VFVGDTDVASDIHESSYFKIDVLIKELKVFCFVVSIYFFFVLFRKLPFC